MVNTIHFSSGGGERLILDVGNERARVDAKSLVASSDSRVSDSNGCISGVICCIGRVDLRMRVTVPGNVPLGAVTCQRKDQILLQ